MDVPTLIVLGAAGGLLRGALDVYTRFVDWQTDRRLHRQSLAAGPAEGEVPRFQGYFDPVADPVAAVVHSLMGAGAAVLFGTTGQISGAYAALVVGMSAPMLLTQLGRIQSVNEVVTGERQQPEPTEPAPAGAPAPFPRATTGGGPAVSPAPSAAPLPPPRPGDGSGVPVFGLAADAEGTPQSRSDGAGPGLDGPGAPRWRQGPAIGEEGRP